MIKPIINKKNKRKSRILSLTSTQFPHPSVANCFAKFIMKFLITKVLEAVIFDSHLCIYILILLLFVFCLIFSGFWDKISHRLVWFFQLPMYTRMTLNIWFSCHHLLNAGLAGIYYHTWFMRCWESNTGHTKWALYQLSLSPTLSTFLI